MPQASRRTRASGGGIAAQLGLSVLTADATQSPSFYVDLLKSRGILDSTVTTRFRVQADSGNVDAPLIDLPRGKGPNPGAPPRRRDQEAWRGRAGRTITEDRRGDPAACARVDPVSAKQVADRMLQLLERLQPSPSPKRRPRRSAVRGGAAHQARARAPGRARIGCRRSCSGTACTSNSPELVRGGPIVREVKMRSRSTRAWRRRTSRRGWTRCATRPSSR